MVAGSQETVVGTIDSVEQQQEQIDSAGITLSDELENNRKEIENDDASECTVVRRVDE